MLMGYSDPISNQAEVDQFSASDEALLNQLTLSNAVNDSPAFRRALTKAELIAAQVRAHYNVTVESCRQAVKTGEAFANALSSLAHCMNMNQLPKHSCRVADIPSRWSGMNCDPSNGLQQINQLLHQFAKYTGDLAARLGEPERVVSDARTQLDHLFDLRAGFHRAADQLESAFSRSASMHTNRAQTDMSSTDSQINGLRQTYQNTAAVYMTNLRSAVSSTPMITYLHSNSLILSAKQEFFDRLNSLSDEASPKPTAEQQSLSVWLNFLAKLVNWTETSRRIARTRDQYSDRQLSDESVQNKPPNETACLEGYLFKRSGKRTWRSWARRWFRLKDNQLHYCKRVPSLSAMDLQSVTESTVFELRCRLKRAESTSSVLVNGNASRTSSQVSLADGHCPELANRLLLQFTPEWKLMESDLRLCTAREGSAGLDRRFTFELISPGNRIHLLQAESYDQKERWVEALRSGLLNFQQANISNTLADSLSLRNASSENKTSSVKSSFTYLNQSVNGAIVKACDLRLSRETHTTLATGTSQQSIPDYDQLRSQGGIVLWREPDWAGNRLCADCSAEGASWASVNLGVTLCTQCAAAHRSLGVHVSKIRSLTLDNWEPELLHLMLNLGNRLVNKVYEGNLDKCRTQIGRPNSTSSSEHRRRWARAKWAQCQFVRVPLFDSCADRTTDTSHWVYDLYEHWLELRRQIQATRSRSTSTSTGLQSPPIKHDHKLENDKATRTKHRYEILAGLCKTLDRLEQEANAVRDRISRRATLLRTEEQELAASSLLCAGARLGCPPLMLAGVAAGAHPDGYPETTRRGSSQQSIGPPLILAVRNGSMSACEFLLLNGADIDVQDSLGRTALHHACQLQRVHLVCLLLRRRADQGLADLRGRLPLDIAVESANADIVTLLRLQRLHDESKQDSDNHLTDDTVTDVFRDYTSRAYYFDSDSDVSDSTLTAIQHSTSSPSINLETSPTNKEKTTILTAKVSREVSPTVTSDRPRISNPTSPAMASDKRRRRFLSPGRVCPSVQSSSTHATRPVRIVHVKHPSLSEKS
ncbi:hypothetical protein EG68_04300 [Paragonimus skrjabini miyazakii]|uniref:Arf-GAP with coiled-coil, ANK repeat and PH domain-containing protein n=1 Tax=Paragonimus skrjabini miyazakii TaxID=59628 RepID=A0A8S9Z3I6_9TREM|nr:hypothetical protein EG68_04300 [Paragonimus skrjabini miyazakii]